MTLAEIIAEAKRQSHNFGTIVLATEDALLLVAGGGAK